MMELYIHEPLLTATSKQRTPVSLRCTVHIFNNNNNNNNDDDDDDDNDDD